MPPNVIQQINSVLNCLQTNKNNRKKRKIENPILPPSKLEKTTQNVVPDDDFDGLFFILFIY